MRRRNQNPITDTLELEIEDWKFPETSYFLSMFRDDYFSISNSQFSMPLKVARKIHMFQIETKTC